MPALATAPVGTTPRAPFSVVGFTCELLSCLMNTRVVRREEERVQSRRRGSLELPYLGLPRTGNGGMGLVDGEEILAISRVGDVIALRIELNPIS